MASTKKPTVSKEALKDAQNLWDRFISFSKCSIAVIIVVLALMALFLV